MSWASSYKPSRWNKGNGTIVRFTVSKARPECWPSGRGAERAWLRATRGRDVGTRQRLLALGRVSVEQGRLPRAHHETAPTKGIKKRRERRTGKTEGRSGDSGADDVVQANGITRTVQRAHHAFSVLGTAGYKHQQSYGEPLHWLTTMFPARLFMHYVVDLDVLHTPSCCYSEGGCLYTRLDRHVQNHGPIITTNLSTLRDPQRA